MIEGLPLTIIHASMVFLGGLVLLGIEFLRQVARPPWPLKVRVKDGKQTIHRSKS